MVIQSRQWIFVVLRRTDLIHLFCGYRESCYDVDFVASVAAGDIALYRL